MTRLNTRGFAGAATMCFIVLLTSLLVDVPGARAAGPMAGTQPPAFYRLMLGKFEITALSDGTHAFPIDTVVEGLSKEQIAADLSLDYLEPPVQGSINAFVINTGDRLILIDSGAGVLYGDCCGRLLKNLRAAGYRPEQIDEVLLTHLHKDHVGGVVVSGKMAFPNAVVRASRVESEYWMNPENKSKAPAFLSSFFDSAIACLTPYIKAGRFKPFDDGARIEEGITAIPLPGHTPGHSGFRVVSDGHVMLAWGDIIHVASIQLRNPEASVEYDTDAAAARRSRLDILDEADRQGPLIAAAHIAFPGLGHVRKEEGHYAWIPVNYDARPAH